MLTRLFKPSVSVTTAKVFFLNALIILHSQHHLNTKKVAEVIAKVLDAPIKSPTEVDSASLSSYGLIGFGSGIYFGKHHKTLLQLADKLPQVTNQQAFIFSTSGQEGKAENFHKKLREKLQSKGYHILSEFNCPGYDTYAPHKTRRRHTEGSPKRGRSRKQPRHLRKTSNGHTTFCCSADPPLPLHKAAKQLVVV